jgi:hypothetical protein
MDDQARQSIREVVLKYGRSVCDEPQRCEALLRDLCPGHGREIHVLVHALRERVAAELLTASAGMPREMLLGRLSKRLEDGIALSPDAARWGVESWALALGVITEAELTPPAASRPPANGSLPGHPGTPAAGAGGYSPPAVPPPSIQTPAAGPHAGSRSSSTAGIIAAIVALTLTIGGGAAIIITNQQQQLAAEQQRQRDEAQRQQQETQRQEAALAQAKQDAEEAKKAAEELRGQLSKLSGASLVNVAASTPAPAGDPHEAASQLVRLAENRREISAKMMKLHRDVRLPLEQQYGTNSSELDRAYAGYPHDNQARAYELMAQEADASAAAAQSLALPDTDRNLLVEYLQAQAQAYRELNQALVRERNSGYMSAKQLWDQQRSGIYLKTKALRERARAAFMQ